MSSKNGPSLPPGQTMFTQEMAEMLDNIPPENRENFEKQFFSLVQNNLFANPEVIFARAFTSEHIEQQLRNEGEETRLRYSDRKSKRKYIFYGLLIGLFVLIGFLIFVIAFLPDQPELMEKILVAFFSFLTGLCSGLGIKSLFENRGQQ